MGWFSRLFSGGGDAPSEEEQRRLSLLLAQCDDADPARRAAACGALAELGDKACAASDKLQELMNDADGDVCNAAAAAYSRIERDF